MKCPYCSNEIPNDAQQCEICGVDLSYQQSQKKTRGFLGIFLTVFGGIFFLFGLMTGLIFLRAQKVMSMYDGVNVFPPLAIFLPCIIGIVLMTIGIISIINSRKLTDENNRHGNLVKSIISVVFVIIFNVIWISTISFMSSSSKQSSTGSYADTILIVFYIVPIITTVSLIASLIKGRK